MLNHQITFERKERLENALAEDYKTICKQQYSKQLLRDNFGDKVKKAKATHKSSHRRCSIKKAVLKNLTASTGKHLCWVHLLKELQARSVNFAKFLRTLILKST